MRNIEGVRQTKYYYDSVYEVWLVRRNLMQCIYLFTQQEAEIVGNSRLSSSVVNSFGSVLKYSLVCGFSPSPVWQI